ncbi:MAG: MBL fold metallo-hydrolase [Actinobacteria bacterium]|nr:MBL fold metallo-hydrolase [Actinomycetota bacterium]
MQHVPPTRIATDTFVVHAHRGDVTGMVVAANVLVLRSVQPVVIDTGMADHREQILDDVFSLVDPDDIGWIVVSHDDVDHTGNVNALMAAAPKAVLVVDWMMQARMGATLDVPLHRQRWSGPGDRLDVGDRVLSAVRPPVFDSPATRAIFDPTTGVLWSADWLGTPLESPVTDVGELDPAAWVEGMAAFDRCTAPWITTIDPRRFQASVDLVEGLGPSVIAGSHTPVIGSGHVDLALAASRRSPDATVAPHPDQTVLERIRRCLEPTPT